MLIIHETDPQRYFRFGIGPVSGISGQDSDDDWEKPISAGPHAAPLVDRFWTLPPNPVTRSVET